MFGSLRVPPDRCIKMLLGPIACALRVSYSSREHLLFSSCSCRVLIGYGFGILRRSGHVPFKRSRATNTCSWRNELFHEEQNVLAAPIHAGRHLFRFDLNGARLSWPKKAHPGPRGLGNSSIAIEALSLVSPTKPAAHRWRIPNVYRTLQECDNCHNGRCRRRESGWVRNPPIF